MATPKIPGEQKLSDRVCYMLKRKVTKFQLLDLTVSELYLKDQLGGGGGKFVPPVQNKVNGSKILF